MIDQWQQLRRKIATQPAGKIWRWDHLREALGIDIKTENRLLDEGLFELVD